MSYSVQANSYANRWIGAAGKMSFAILLGLFLSACAGVDMRTDRQVASDRVNAYLAANPGTAEATAAAMRRHVLKNGMTRQQVVAVWGPSRRKLKWRGGTEDQWYFECNTWPNTCRSLGRRKGRSDDDIYPQAFFKNGRLTGWKKP